MKTLTQTGLMLLLLLTFTITISAQEIFDAVRKGDLAKVKELLQNNPEYINKANNRLETLLHIASGNDDKEMTSLLIEKGSNLKSLDGYFYTPLMVAGLNSARVLIDNGSDINYISPDGLNALISSVYRGNKELVEYFIDKGAIIPSGDDYRKMDILSYALKAGSVKYLEMILELGLKYDAVDLLGNNLLHFASRGNSSELLYKLINMGVLINKKNVFGWTPLHRAVMSGNKTFVELLVKKGADINAKTADGKTVYNLAKETKKNEIEELLLNLGADKTTNNSPIIIGEYLGQKKPGKKAVPFDSPIIASIYNFHGNFSFSKDGNEVLWERSGAKILTSKIVNGRWIMPDTVKFVTEGGPPFFSPDGKKLYFNKYVEDGGKRKEVICAMDKTQTGWTQPYNLPDIINSIDGIHWQVSVDMKGNLYFGVRQNGYFDFRIYFSEYNKGYYSKPQIVEGLEDINAHSPYISSDGSYLIISQRGKGNGLSILFKKRNGKWTKGKDFTNIIGVPGINKTLCPMVTCDGKYLFFGVTEDTGTAPFWVDASFIEDLRKEALKDDK